MEETYFTTLRSFESKAVKLGFLFIIIILIFILENSVEGTILWLSLSGLVAFIWMIPASKGIVEGAHLCPLIA